MGSLDVRAFGAHGDGEHLDTPAINAAIDKAAADGGGTEFCGLIFHTGFTESKPFPAQMGTCFVSGQRGGRARYDVFINQHLQIR